MKKTLSRIFSVFLVVLLLASLPMVQAFADYSCKYGEYSEIVLAQFSGKDDNNLVGKASVTSGSIPGMSLKISGDATQIQLVGTPTKAGTFTIGYSFEMKDGQPGSNTATVNVAAETPTVKITSNTTTPGKNENFSFTLNMTGGSPYTVTVFTKAGKDADPVQGTTWTLDGSTETVWVGCKLMEDSVQTYYYYFTVKNNAGTATSNTIAITNPGYTATPEPTPTPAIKITKQPTGETVEAGGRAAFVARAENYDKFVWRLVSPDTTNTIPAADAPAYFSGLKVSGTDSEKLVLENIPESLDGWKAECKFIAADGKTFVCTNGAVIKVNKAELKRPTISSQPVGGSKNAGESITLTVSASDPNGGTLHYQWYSNTAASTAGGKLINGATSASYTPPETEGTVYYFAAVWSTKDGRSSERVNTGAVAVTYSAAATPAPTETAAPVTPLPSADVSGDPNNGTNGGNNDGNNDAQVDIKPEKSGNGLLVLLLVIAGLGLIAAAVLLILAKREEKPKTVKGPGEKRAAAAAKRGWTCPQCGEVNLGRFCQNCGAPKPANEPLYICDKCGWEPKDPKHPPRFCPQCGDPFGPEDIADDNKQ